MQLIRPVNKTDLDTMSLLSREKLKDYREPNESLKPYPSNLGAYFNTDKMRQHKSGLLGIFKGYTIKNIRDTSGRFGKFIFAIVQPNKDFFHPNYYYKFAPPSNYVLVDSTIYLVPIDIRTKQPGRF